MSADTAHQPRIEAEDWLTLAGLSVLWGGSFLFYKVLSTQLPALSTVAGRVVIGAAATALLFTAIRSSVLPPRATWGRFVLLGLLNNVIPFTALAWGETRVSSGTAAIINALTPAATLLMSVLVFRTERLTPARVGGIACAFAGVAVLVGPAALAGQDVTGALVCMAAPLSYGLGVPFGRTIRGVTPAQLAMGQLAASSAIVLPLSLAWDRPWTLPPLDAAGWAALLGLAVLSTAVAYVFFFRLLARVGATNLTLVTFLVPISALLFGRVLLAEPITAQAIGGIMVVAAGLMVIDGRPQRWLRQIAATRRTAR